jgi:hypothetical protein
MVQCVDYSDTYWKVSADPQVESPGTKDADHAMAEPG